MFGATSSASVRLLMRVEAVALGILLLFADLVRAGELDRYDALANGAMAEGRPTYETSKALKDELLFQRATQTYLWALPLIKHARNEGRFGEDIRCRLSCASCLEKAPRCQDAGDHTKLRRHLRHELPRSRQGWGDGA